MKAYTGSYEWLVSRMKWTPGFFWIYTDLNNVTMETRGQALLSITVKLVCQLSAIVGLTAIQNLIKLILSTIK